MRGIEESGIKGKDIVKVKNKKTRSLGDGMEVSKEKGG